MIKEPPCDHRFIEVNEREIKVCGHPLRFKILCRIERNVCAADLWQPLNEAQPVISQHSTILKGISKKPHLVLDSNFSAATALSKCSRSPAALRFCRLVSTKNFFVNFLKLFLRGALKKESIVESSVEGNRRLYRIEDDFIQKIIQIFLQLLLNEGSALG